MATDAQPVPETTKGFSAANNAFESVQKAVKQASDVAEANFNAVANTAADAAKNAAPRK